VHHSPYPTWNRLLTLALGALLFGLGIPTEARAQETGSLHVVVTEAGTDRPLAGAQVWIESLARGGSADREGRAILTGIPHGDYIVEVRLLGFGSARVPVTVPRTSPIRVGLGAQPIRLDGIIVEAEGVLRIRARRAAIPRIMEAAFDLSELFWEQRSLHEIIEDLFAESGRRVGMCSGQNPNDPPFCVWGEYGGRGIPMRFCVDERPYFAYSFFEHHEPRDFHTLEIFGRGRQFGFTVYAYTHRFIERQLAEGRALSWFLPCQGVPR
jgi:hypothetical protein